MLPSVCVCAWVYECVFSLEIRILIQPFQLFNSFRYACALVCRIYNRKLKPIALFTIVSMAPAANFWVRSPHKRMRLCCSVAWMK